MCGVRFFTPAQNIALFSWRWWNEVTQGTNWFRQSFVRLAAALLWGEPRGFWELRPCVSLSQKRRFGCSCVVPSPFCQLPPNAYLLCELDWGVYCWVWHGGSFTDHVEGQWQSRAEQILMWALTPTFLGKWIPMCIKWRWQDSLCSLRN